MVLMVLTVHIHQLHTGEIIQTLTIHTAISIAVMLRTHLILIRLHTPIQITVLAEIITLLLLQKHQQLLKVQLKRRLKNDFLMPIPDPNVTIPIVPTVPNSPAIFAEKQKNNK